jgi:hypothetical protein
MMENISIELQDVGREDVDWINLVQEMDQWR